jgi:hypothetical protein
MHGIDAARGESIGHVAAARHRHDFELQPVRLIDAGVIGHPNRQKGVGRRGLADPECCRIGFACCRQASCQSRGSGSGGECAKTSTR